MALTYEQARRAMATLEDVFTDGEGDAVVIDRLHTFTNPTHPLYGKGHCARATGHQSYNCEGVWIPLAELTASEDL